MTGMIERLERALVEAEGCCADDAAKARYILRAIRLPTEGMVKAGVMACSASMTVNEPQGAVIYGQPKAIWTAMADFALEGKDAD